MQGQDLYKELFELSNDGLCIASETKILLCNDTFIKMLGYDTQEEILNYHPAELSPKFQPDGTLSHIKANKMLEESSGKVFEWIHQKKNGEEIWCDVTLKPIIYEGKSSTFGTIRDITEKKELEQKLKFSMQKDLQTNLIKLEESKTLFETIFNSNMYAIAIMNLQSDFLLVNDSYTTLTGYTKEELYKESCVSLTHPDMIEDSKKGLDILLANGFHNGFEKLCAKKDGTYIYVMMDAVLLPNKKEILLVVKDISEEKKYKNEKILHEEQMLQQSRLAQMGEMISMIAHQWRQPLGAISTTAVNLRMKIEFESFDLETKEGIEEAGKYFIDKLENIENFVETLTHTIDDFRNFYKPNKESITCKLEIIFSKALKIIRDSLRNDNIKIIYSSDSAEELEIYDSELMQVILNILKNAQDNFREKRIDNPKLNIVTKYKSISICDNGGGISDDIIENIFDPYFSTKNKKNGTGLGLYMSKIIVEEHHYGKLKVENKNDGVCFTIDLEKRGGGIYK